MLENNQWVTDNIKEELKNTWREIESGSKIYGVQQKHLQEGSLYKWTSGNKKNLE